MYAVISVESSPVVSALHKVCLKITEKGFSHQDMMRVPVTDFIDLDVTGTSPELRPRAADLASFTAGYLGRLIQTPEFQSISLLQHVYPSNSQTSVLVVASKSHVVAWLDADNGVILWRRVYEEDVGLHTSNKKNL